MTKTIFDPAPGLAETLEPDLQRVLAPNPSPMTFRGTNTYILGARNVAVIDPGPAEPQHLRAILDAVGPARHVTHVLVTHAHADHSSLARPLSEATGAPVLAFGSARDGISPVMRKLSEQEILGDGEGIDENFTPDVRVADGETVSGEGWEIQCLWTPGHMGGHLSFAWRDAVFTGDLLMGWATSLISPPEGDMGAYFTSCRRLAARDDRICYPGHGAPITRPRERSLRVIEHRMQREGQILSALEAGAASPAALTRRIYTALPTPLLAAAERNVLAHLIDLWERKAVTAAPHFAPDAEFRLAQRGKHQKNVK